MDKDDLDIASLLARFNAQPVPRPANDTPQKLLMALFFMVVGLILMATGFISLLLRLASMVHLPMLWLIQRTKNYQQVNIELERRLKHR
ncbi:hypothetical protein [Cellvibrio mixtus]|uniref:hypothetical protein n=1 Tax=Cellvibrio mixtus TaxID=39650 RepID=UPI000587758E|nr:hypothetical protein [Cellvibrio mixtus]